MNAKCLPFFLLLCAWGTCEAQLQTFDYANSTVGSGGFVRFNNYGELGQKNSDKLDYADVRGNCFWDKEWNPAILILKNGKGVKIKKVKLNFYTNDIHYVDDRGTELVAQNGINKIVFFDRKDTTKVLAVFEGIAGFKIKDTDAFVQLLVEGRIQLMKRTEVTMIKKDNGPMMDNPDFKFLSEVVYYLKQDGSISNLKTISKTNLFSILKPMDEDETWLKTNKNKLKTETDVISFLMYRNSLKK